jgi:hypothetical protein
MRCLERDKQLVLIAFFVEKAAVENAEGKLTGKHKVVRTDPIPYMLSVSASKGSAENSPFGIDLDYDRTVIIEDIDCPIDESSVLWIDNVALATNSDEINGAFNTDLTGDKPHDYIVKRVAKSPNCIAVAVKHVEVSR